MTEKIYYEDTYCREFDAAVVSCEKVRERYEIVLDRTAFYPEGGGQPGDRGIIENAEPGQDGPKKVRILDTHEKDGQIRHYADQPLKEGTKVHGRIDWQYRFDMMQNHSGEHIVSGLIHKKYGYENVGFHMGSDFITIDLSGELTMDQLREIEDEANQIIWNDCVTDIKVYDEEAVKSIEYRSKKELHGQVRIVTFPGADVCACCGRHVARTGEIGLIRIYSCVRFHSGVRVELLCGRRALEYDRILCEQNQKVSMDVSAKPFETAAGVEKVIETGKNAVFQYMELQRMIDRERAHNLTGVGNLAVFIEGKNMDAVGKSAAEIMENCGGICAVFSGTAKAGFCYAIGQKDGDCREFVKEMNQTLNGRGGGKPFFAQGKIQAEKREIKEFFRTHKGNWLIFEMPY